MKKIAILIFILPMVCNAQKNIAYHSLEVTYIGLNALDLVTTYQAIDRGAYEVNPVMSKILDNKPLVIGTKALFTTAFLGGCRAIRKDHRKAAFLLLLAGNISYGLIVNHNYQVSVRLKI